MPAKRGGFEAAGAHGAGDNAPGSSDPLTSREPRAAATGAPEGTAEPFTWCWLTPVARLEMIATRSRAPVQGVETGGGKGTQPDR
jgi:hypothetical protein